MSPVIDIGEASIQGCENIYSNPDIAPLIQIKRWYCHSALAKPGCGLVQWRLEAAAVG
jgi:hypothetical protein